MSKSYMNKIRVYLNQTNNKGLKGYANDMNGAIYFSDGYSVIRLFDDSYVRKQRLEIVETFDRVRGYEHSIVKHFTNFENQNFNQFTRVVDTIKEDIFNEVKAILKAYNMKYSDFINLNIKIAKLSFKYREMLGENNNE